MYVYSKNYNLKILICQIGEEIVVPHGVVSVGGEAARRGLPWQLPRPRVPRPQRLQALQARRAGLPTAAAAAEGISRRGYLHLRRPSVLNPTLAVREIPTSRDETRMCE